MTRQETEREEGKGRETGGLDTVHVSLYGECAESCWPLLRRRLDELQVAAQEGDDDAAFYETCQGDRLTVFERGAKLGGVYFAWHVEWEGNHLFIRKGWEYSESMPLILVQFKAIPLMQRRPIPLYRDLLQVLNLLGYRIRNHVVGRVDPCADLVGVSVDQISKPAMVGHEVTKAKSGRLFFGATSDDHQSFYRGNSDRVLMRAYDKLDESFGDLVKQDLMRQRRWGGEIPAAATRVEFQLGREVLREEWQITTLEDLEKFLPSIVHWLTHNWYRLASLPVDRKNRNQSRVETAGVWKVVQDAFAAWVGKDPAAGVRVERRVMSPKQDMLRKQMVGVAKSLLALAEPVYETPRAVLKAVMREFREVAGDLMKGVERRRRDFEGAYANVLAVAWDIPWDVPDCDLQSG